MLLEFKNVYHPEGEPKRRWFSDEYFDLILWYNEEDAVLGFQLCYDKPRSQKALTWMSPSLYFHMRIDDGENRLGHYKATPILVPDGVFDHNNIARRFKEESVQLEPSISELVYAKILDYQ